MEASRVTQHRFKLEVQQLHRILFQSHRQPNKALQLTANPLRSLSAAEIDRYVALTKLGDVVVRRDEG